MKTAGALLFVLWFAGFATSYTMGGLIHLFLIGGAVATAFGLARGNNVFERPE